MGASYKSPQFFGDFDFESAYLDGSSAPNVLFNMDYPAIYSAGVGYSNSLFDLALDYRLVDYENTDGFMQSGWTQTGSVAGFGWQNISILSAGVQFKGIENLPLRVGYTYNSNPIQDDLVFFSAPATAVTKNAFQFGLGFEASEMFGINVTYHHGMSGDATSGPLLNPMLINENDPLGKVPGSEIAYDMVTDLILIGLNFKF